MTARHAFAVLLTLALAGSAAVARAQSGSAADQQALTFYEQGSQAYTEGRYEESVRLFSDAYRLSPRPLLLFNLANAYERIGRYADAVSMLEGFLPHAPYQERSVIQTRITNLRARVDAGEGTTAGGGGGGGGDVLVPVGLGVGLGGVALVAAGVVFAVFALDARDVQGGDGAPCRDTADGRLLCTGAADGPLADAELFALLADIGLIGGGTIAAAGLVLLLVGVASGSRTSGSGGGTAALVPDVQLGLNGGTFGVRGRF